MRYCQQRRLRLSLLSLLAIVGCTSLAAREVVALYSSSSHQEMRVAPGSKIVVNNRFEFGSVVVTGWDRDVVQAMATIRNGSTPVQVQVTKDLNDPKRVLVTTAPEDGGSNTGGVRLEVKVPQYVELEAIHVPKAALEVTDVNGSVAVSSGSGSISVRRVGSLKARSGSGDLLISGVKGPVAVQKSSGPFTISDVEGNLTSKFESGHARLANIRGSIDVTTATGNVEINNAGGDVRIVSINGRTNIECAAGRVEVRDTSGVVTLASIAGDVDVTTSNGRATYTGVIYAGRRYRLKTLSGAVLMAVSDEAAGFTATLSSYTGSVQTDFDLKPEASSQSAGGNHRIVGTYGGGRSQIELDSFNGRVRLSKVSSSAVKKCER